MKWFRRNQKAKNQTFILDYDDSRDPWDSPTVHFFRDKKARKGSSAESYTSMERQNPFWAKEPSKLSIPRLNAASQKYKRPDPQCGSVVISPDQRLYDVSPEDFRPQVPAGESVPLSRDPRLGTPRPQTYDDVRFVSRSQLAPSRASSDQDLPKTRRVFVDNPQVNQQSHLSSYPPDGVNEKSKDSFENPSAFSRQEGGTPGTSTYEDREHYAASQPSVSRGGRQEGPFQQGRDEYSGQIQQGTAPGAGDEISRSQRMKKTFINSKKLNVILKIGSVFFFLFLVLFLLFTFSQRSRSPLLEEELLEIPSPEHIKVRPPEPNKSLIPYQDELIYGQIEETPETVGNAGEGERLLPSSDFPPEIQDEAEVVSTNHVEDEYLDVDDVPASPKSSNNLSATEDDTSTAQKTQDKMEQFLRSFDENSTPKPPTARQFSSNSAKISQKASQPRVSKSSAPVPLQKANESRPQPVVSNKGAPTPAKSSSRSQPPIKKSPEKNPVHKTSDPVYLQLGTLPSIDTARTEARRLAAKYSIFTPYQMRVQSFKSVTGKTVYRILLGPIPSAEKARSLLRQTGGRFYLLPQ